MRKSILHVLNYFHHFEYPPTIDELYLFLPQKITKKALIKNLNILSHEKKIILSSDRVGLMAKVIYDYQSKKRISELRYKRLKRYIRLIQYIPTIQLLGISGTLSMYDSAEEDDIDIFVISKAHLLWTTRFCLLLIKKFSQLLMRRTGSNFCLNLFFDERDLRIPHSRQNEYTGHEVLQMKPLINKNKTYEKFLSQNAWVSNFFPNVQINTIIIDNDKRGLNSGYFLYFFEKIIEKVQKSWLNLKGIPYCQENGQIWLVEDYYEAAMRDRV